MSRGRRRVWQDPAEVHPLPLLLNHVAREAPDTDTRSGSERLGRRVGVGSFQPNRLPAKLPQGEVSPRMF